MLEQRRLPPEALGRPAEPESEGAPGAQPSPPADPPPAQ
jgi:hypothetical protein